MAQIRALQEEQGRLADKVDRLEAQQALLNPKINVSKSSLTSEIRSTAPLAVVKLKPRNGPPAPRLSTAVPVLEPEGDALEEVQQAVDNTPVADASVLELEFQESLNALKTGNVEGGIAKLQRFAKANPSHPRADNALYYSAVGLMALGEYKSAVEVLKKLLSRYPAGDAVPEALLKLGECHLHQKQADEAKALYSKVVAHYPGSFAAAEAQTRLSSLDRRAP